MILSAIVAVDLDQAIGKDGQLLCPIPADLRYFKHKTEGHVVICGRKTLYTFPGQKPLANRRSFILSRDPNFRCPGAEVYHNLEDLLAKLQTIPGEHFVIGGQSIYQLFAPYVDRMYITQIFHRFPQADTHFCRQGSWKLVQASPVFSDEATGYRFQFLEYHRI